MNKLRVIIRTEANHFGKEGFHWVAVFPDDKANPGRILYVPFEIRNGIFYQLEPFGEMSLSWYYADTKYVKPMVLDSYGVKEAIQKWYNDDPYEEPVKLEFRCKLPDLAKTAWAWALKPKEG